MQGSRLTSCTLIAAEVQAACSSLALEGAGVGREWGEAQAAGINGHKYLWNQSWWKLLGAQGGYTGHLFPSVVWLQNRALWTTITPSAWLLLVVLLFFSPPSHFYMYQLYQSVCGETRNRSLVLYLKRLEKLVPGLTFPFLARGLFLAENVPLGIERCQLGEWDDAGWRKLSDLSSCVVILRFFVPLCGKNSSGGSRALFLIICG